jgi:hypothetical protein
VEEKSHYYGGNIWQAPSFLRCMIVCGDGKMFLISDPANSGSTIKTEKDGTWLYDMKDLPKRLENWKWIGTHIDYIENLVKEQ